MESYRSNLYLHYLLQIFLFIKLFSLKFPHIFIIVEFYKESKAQISNYPLNKLILK